MLSNDANILKIKHEILYQVAKLAYAGQLEEKKEELPYELLPGPQAKYRCCVYKEREVVRQRIRLAEGKCPSETPKTGKDNVVQVIEAACADCPLSHYIVTDNCRKCMAKACQQACKFGAVSISHIPFSSIVIAPTGQIFLQGLIKSAIALYGQALAH